MTGTYVQPLLIEKNNNNHHGKQVHWRRRANRLNAFATAAVRINDGADKIRNDSFWCFVLIEYALINSLQSTVTDYFSRFSCGSIG